MAKMAAVFCTEEQSEQFSASAGEHKHNIISLGHPRHLDALCSRGKYASRKEQAHRCSNPCNPGLVPQPGIHFIFFGLELHSPSHIAA